MTKVNEKTENATIVNGVVLTNDAIARLVELQAGDNDGIRSAREILSDAICMMALMMDNYNHEPTQDKAKRLMIDMSYIRDNFNDLRKP